MGGVFGAAGLLPDAALAGRSFCARNRIPRPSATTLWIHHLPEAKLPGRLYDLTSRRVGLDRTVPGQSELRLPPRDRDLSFSGLWDRNGLSAS